MVSLRGAFVILLFLIVSQVSSTAQKGTKAASVQINSNQDPVQYPDLYTGNFDNCLGDDRPLIIDKFAVGYYTDDSTLVFQLKGTRNAIFDNLTRE